MPTDATPVPASRRRTPPALKAARWVLFGLLLLAAGLALFGLPEMQREIADGRAPSAALWAPAVLLGLFAVGYAAYRIVLVRLGRYPAGKALFRIVLVAAVVGAAAGIVLLPPEPRPASDVGVDLAGPLRSADPEVRALAAEVVRSRPRAQALAHVDRLIEILDDPAPAVRHQARLSLRALAGRDFGGEGPAAAARWREHFRRTPGR